MRCERQMENWTNESRRACYGVIISIVVVIKKNPFQIQTEVEQLTKKMKIRKTVRHLESVTDSCRLPRHEKSSHDPKGTR